MVGCTAQEIVKEIAIYRRERLIGIGAHSYLIAKFHFLVVVSSLQALVIYGCTLLFEGGRDGSASWQILALIGTALAGVGIGTAISALARSLMQAVMIVPLVLIPLIIFSGYTVPPAAMSEASPKVLAVAKLMPTFSAQTMMDTSFLWKRVLEGELMRDHAQSYQNLVPDRELTTGDIYEKAKPAWWALAGHALWLLGSYLTAWLALRAKERG